MTAKVLCQNWYDQDWHAAYRRLSRSLVKFAPFNWHNQAGLSYLCVGKVCPCKVVVKLQINTGQIGMRKVRS